MAISSGGRVHILCREPLSRSRGAFLRPLQVAKSNLGDHPGLSILEISESGSHLRLNPQYMFWRIAESGPYAPKQTITAVPAKVAEIQRISGCLWGRGRPSANFSRSAREMTRLGP